MCYFVVFLHFVDEQPLKNFKEKIVLMLEVMIVIMTEEHKWSSLPHSVCLIVKHNLALFCINFLFLDRYSMKRNWMFH